MGLPFWQPADCSVQFDIDFVMKCWLIKYLSIYEDKIEGLGEKMEERGGRWRECEGKEREVTRFSNPKTWQPRIRRRTGEQSRPILSKITVTFLGPQTNSFIATAGR